MLQLHDVGKAFAAPVLRDVSLELAGGEIHGLVGANGAGKSTLCNIIAGVHAPDTGSLVLDGETVERFSPAAARHAGVQYVHQELNQIPTLSVAENLFLAALPRRFGFIDRAALNALARSALARVGLDHIQPSTPLQSLGVGVRQLIEIAAALAADCRVLILDEPTAALSAHESAFLYEQIRQIAARGVTVVFVSHKLDEVLAICQRVSVLRDGRLVGTYAADNTSDDELLEHITGNTSGQQRHFVSHVRPSMALAVRDFGAPGWVPIQLQVARGERVGVAGLVGAGRSTLLRMLFGAQRATHGSLSINGRACMPFHHPSAARQAGLALVSEDRKLDGLLLDLSVERNVNLISPPHHLGWVSPGAAEEASRLCATLDTRLHHIHQPVAQLSGGNQQKVVLAKWLRTAPSVLLLDEPTRGVDAAARQRIHSALAELAAQGIGLLIASSDLAELTANCDRIITLRERRITGHFTRDTWQEDAITRAMFNQDVA